MRPLAIVILCIAPLFGQNRCELPIPSITPPGTTIFTPQQEDYLGEFFHETLRRGIAVYNDSTLTAPLDRIADRLLRYLPATGYQFRFTLIELPSINAFAISGGRIFVARKLIAFVEDEDELAGVLAHEMGHVLARQQSVEISKDLRDVLKVTTIGDREDVFRRMNQLLDTPAKGRGRGREDDQIEADRISFEAVLRAGYRPEATPAFFDRMANNQGRTGNFITDLFGATSPAARRYREMLREIGSIPEACRESRAASGDEEFRQWKQRVSELSPEDRLSGLPDRAPTLELAPKLRPDLHTIRFSRDGRLLFAQDDSGITILQREPLQTVFRIPATGARAALFHADGSRIVFQAGGRIEVWNLETRTREHRWEPNFSFPCPQLVLSPDGHSGACIANAGSLIRLVDVPTGKEIAAKQTVFQIMNPDSILALLVLPAGSFQFSPDGSVFLASFFAPNARPWAYDVSAGKEISIGNPLRGMLHSTFAFLDSQHVAAIHIEDNRKSGIFEWPGGKEIKRLTIPTANFTATTNGDTRLLRPFRNYAFGAMDLDQQTIYIASPAPAFDRYGDISAAERNTGEIAFYAGKTTRATVTLQLPGALVGTARGAAHSPDLRWLALSVRGRSAIWDLQSGRAMPMRSFENGYISAAGILTMTQEQPDTDEQNRPSGLTPHRVAINPATLGQLSNEKLVDKPGKERLYSERYELTYEIDPRDRNKVFAQVRDVIGLKTLWSRDFPVTSRLHFGNTLVLQYPARTPAAEAILKANPGLREQIGDMAGPAQAFVLEALRLDNGESLGAVVVEPIPIARVNVAGRNLFIEDANNRTMVYSLDGSGRGGQQFGRVVATDAALGQVAVSNQLGTLAVFDSAMKPVAEFNYPANTIYAGFDGAGKRLLVVTGEQEVFIENLP